MGRQTKMNKLTSPELIAQILPANTGLLKEFLDYLKGINRSSGTIDGYKNDLEIFLVWNATQNANKPFQKINKRDLVRYQSWLINDNENSPSRVRRLRSAISSLSNYVENIIADEDEDFAGFRSIVKKIEAPPLEKTREKTVWSEPEINDLLNRLVEQKQYEKACCIALAAFSGRRKSELMRYKVSFFDSKNLIADGALYMTPKIKTKGRGTSGKMLATYVLAKKFQPYLDLWLEERKAIGLESEWLFPDPSNPTVARSVTTLNSWATTFSRMLDRPVYFHSFRHAFTSMLLEAGLPENVVTEILGWSSAEMIRHYDDRPASDQIEKYFVGGEISAPQSKSLSEL